jgi:hypothetical protein
VDLNARSDADLIHDLDSTPWPLPADHFTEVHCPAVIEHLNRFYPVFEEIHRVCRGGARVHVSVPHYTDTAAFTDPTHVRHFTSYSFDVLTGDTQWAFYTEARYRLVSCRITLLRVWRWVGAEWLVNAGFGHPPLRFLRKFWENYLCFLVRGKSMDLVLEVVKPENRAVPEPGRERSR